LKQGDRTLTETWNLRVPPLPAPKGRESYLNPFKAIEGQRSELIEPKP
jgi:hypothetical protein